MKRQKIFYDKYHFYLVPLDKEYWAVIRDQQKVGHTQLVLNALIYINLMREFFNSGYQLIDLHTDKPIIDLSFQKAKDSAPVMDFFINELVDDYTNLNFDTITLLTAEKNGLTTTIRGNGVVETEDKQAEQLILKHLNKTIKRSPMD